MPKMIVYAGQGYKAQGEQHTAQAGDRLAVPNYGVVIARVPGDGLTSSQRRQAKREQK